MLRKHPECVYSPQVMKSSAFGRATAMGVMYVAVFIVLVLIQFPSAGPVSAVAGDVAFKGLPGKDGEGIRSAEVTTAGLRLVFSERMPVTFVDSSGAERSAFPVAYEKGSNGFIIRFDDGSTLETKTVQGGQATWTLIPKKAAAVAHIRYELAYGAALLAPGDDGSLRLSVGGATWRVAGVSAGKDTRSLTVTASKGSLKPFIASIELEGKPSTSTQFIAQAPMDPAAWSKELTEWRDKAWKGLSGESFNATEGTWTSGAGAPAVFDEASFMAYAAEALRRSRPEQVATLVSVARSAHSDKLSWKSAPFAGRTMTSMAAFEESNLAEIKAAERLIQARTSTLFYTKGIIPTLFDRAPYSLAQEAMVLARASDFSKADVVQVVSLLEAFLDSGNYLSASENPFAKVVDLVDKVLAPSVQKVEGGFYLQTASDGTCDTLTGLNAGTALIRLAKAVDKPIYEGIGQSLVTSLLKLAADNGSMPASVSIANGIITSSRDRMAAAIAYPLLADSPYYPHAVSYYSQLGPGAWAWTCAPSLNVESTASGTVFTAQFPVGYSHYVALYGVKPFVKIQLYELDYNMDAGFESYNASGYFFKKSAGAMYLKMRHKVTEERIRLFY